LESAAGEAMTTPILQKLDEWQRVAETTTKGEWHWKASGPSTARVWADSGPVINEKIYIGDAEFITTARTIVPAQNEALREAIEALELSPCTGNGDVHVASCNKCAALSRIESILCGVKG
jgi:hypothetical protein